MPTMFIRPRPGLVVRDPQTLKPLPAEGAEVAASSHWRRRIADGDVTTGRPPAKTQATKTGPAKADKTEG